MACVNLECGDRASSSFSATVGDLERSGDSVDDSGVRYVLSPSPSFDPIFDDLLEGGTGSGVSIVRGEPKSESVSMADESARKIEYLNELLRDQKSLADKPDFFHLNALLSREIERVRDELRIRNASTPTTRAYSFFRRGKFNLDPFKEMPPAEGPIVTMVEKVYAPIEQHPNFNFIGRLVGPRGRTVKQIEDESGCQITIRGRGSERSVQVEDKNRGQIGYEHLNETLHVRISTTDHKERAAFKVRRAKSLVERLLVPVDTDELKQNQLRELAFIRNQCRVRYRNQLPSPYPSPMPMPTDENFPPLTHSMPVLDQMQPSTPQFVTPVYYIADPSLTPLTWPSNVY